MRDLHASSKSLDQHKATAVQNLVKKQDIASTFEATRLNERQHRDNLIIVEIHHDSKIKSEISSMKYIKSNNVCFFLGGGIDYPETTLPTRLWMRS